MMREESLSLGHMSPSRLQRLCCSLDYLAKGLTCCLIALNRLSANVRSCSFSNGYLAHNLGLTIIRDV
jgi:hypothetical protein